jgi:hypothetical protein
MKTVNAENTVITAKQIAKDIIALFRANGQVNYSSKRFVQEGF